MVIRRTLRGRIPIGRWQRRRMQRLIGQIRPWDQATSHRHIQRLIENELGIQVSLSTIRRLIQEMDRSIIRQMNRWL